LLRMTPAIGPVSSPFGDPSLACSCAPAPELQSSEMSSSLSNCSNCGGRISRSGDGRTIACNYCGSSESVSIDPRALASGIMSDSKSLHAGFDHLLATFRQTLPEQTVVEQSGLLFKKATAFSVTLGDYTFRLSRDGSRLVAKRIMTVRGITLKTEPLSLEEWLTSLAEQLAGMASDSAAARDAFSRIAR
jgi:hypothetical protein